MKKEEEYVNFHFLLDRVVLQTGLEESRPNHYRSIHKTSLFVICFFCGAQPKLGVLDPPCWWLKHHMYRCTPSQCQAWISQYIKNIYNPGELIMTYSEVFLHPRKQKMRLYLPSHLYAENKHADNKPYNIFNETFFSWLRSREWDNP